jgi:hypothetical protein
MKSFRSVLSVGGGSTQIVPLRTLDVCRAPRAIKARKEGIRYEELGEPNEKTRPSPDL